MNMGILKKQFWVNTWISTNFFSFSKLVNKVFGNLVYDKQISNYFNNEYCVYSFGESLEISENIKFI